MTTKLSNPGAPILPYRRILPEGYICLQPQHIRESMLQAEPIAESDHLLREHFSGLPGTLVDSGGFVFYDPEDLRRRRVRPDLYIVFGVDTESVLGRQGYVIAEAGKPPDFALEVASHTTRRSDLRRKPGLYARIGIGEYWRFDPTGNEYYGTPLAGDILVDGEYQPVEITTEEDGMLWGYSPMLDLCLCAKDVRLMYYDRKTSSYLHSIGEEKAAHRETAAELDRVTAERDSESAIRLLTAAERDAERAARQESEAKLEAELAAKLVSDAEIERLREKLRRLQEGE